MPTFTYERRLGGLVAGVDEAGRGPLAGPVVAAAVVFRGCNLPRALSGRIDDSKRLTPEDRADAFAALRRLAQGGDIRGLNAKGCAEYTRKQIDELTEYVKQFGAKGLAYLALPVDGEPRSTFSKFLSPEILVRTSG